MKQILLGGPLVLVALVISACDQTPLPQVAVPQPVTEKRIAGTVSMTVASSPDASSDVLTGRTLTLEVGTRGWNENLGSTALYGFDAKPVSSTIIDTTHAYSLTLPNQVSASALAPISSFWTTTPFSSGTCSVQSQQYSDLTMNIGLGTLRVLAGGNLTRKVDVGLPTDWRSRTPVADVVSQALVYADRAGNVSVAYDCTSEFNFRMKSDTKLSLQAGWNVLVKHSVESGGTGTTGTVYTYEVRSRPLSTIGEPLAYLGDTVYFDAP
jgi:hypothetical protein